MRVQGNKLDFKGQNNYISALSKKDWSEAVLSESCVLKKFR